MLTRTSLALLLLGVCANLRAQDITTGLVAYWAFDETSGNTAADSSGNGNNGTAVNHSWVSSGRVGGCIELDGSFDYVSVNNSTSLQIDGEVTLTAWVKADAVSAEHCIIGHGTTSSPVQNTYLYAWYGDWLGGSHDSGNDEFANANVPSGDIGQWTHLAAVFTGSQWRLYRNGQLFTFHNTSQGAQNQSGGRWAIGAPSSLSSRFFDGQIDEVRVYSRALSDTDVDAVYRDGWSGAAGDLDARWKLDETNGTTATDSGGGGLDGTYGGGVPLAQGGPYPGTDAPLFDGSDDHVDLPSINGDFSSGLTIAAWVAPSSAPSGSSIRTFVNLSNGTNVDEIWFGWVGNSGLQLYLSDTADGSSVRTIEDNSGFTLGRWVHCVATVDASGNATLYRNGQVTKSGFYTSLPKSIARTETSIATSPWNDNFSGGLQDVRVYSRGLSACEVAELYGLVGHWKLDETSGATAVDDSGCDHDGDYTGGFALDSEGVRNRAASFDGIDAEVTSFEAGDALDASEALSLAGWVRLNSLGTSSVRLAGNGRSEGFRLEVTSAGLPRFHIHADVGKRDVTATETIELDRWTHLAGVYDGASLRLYIDGVLHRTSTVTAGSLVDNSHAFIIGNSTSGDNALDGEIDDVVAYNRAMSDREIAEHYGLVGWWRMEETSGTDVADSSGADNHGTIAGSATWSTDAKEGDGSLSLDGTDYMETPSTIIDGADGATILGWARLTDADTGGAELISLGDHLAIRLDESFESRGTNAFAYNGSTWELAQHGTHEDTGWRHFAAVYDKESLELQLFIDGTLRSTELLDTAVIFGSLDEVTRIGNHTRHTTGYRFTGDVDDVRVYNRPLTLQEIQEVAGTNGSSGVRIVRWLEAANP